MILNLKKYSTLTFYFISFKRDDFALAGLSITYIPQFPTFTRLLHLNETNLIFSNMSHDM